MRQDGQLLNYIGGEWRRSRAVEFLVVRNPATAETIVRVPITPVDEVDEAAQVAQSAFADWRRTPPTERIQYLFKFKQLLDEHFDEIACLTTQECGKTLAEAQGELRRGIENVEVATGIPSLMMGYNVEDIARGIDEHMLRQPLGVVAAITPFNFPGMIPLWFLPYAIACGNCFILKPSEKVPMTMSRVFEQIDNAATTRKVGYGLDPEVETGPVITAESKQRIESLIGKGMSEGAEILVDGRESSISGYERGYFVRPTVLDNVNPRSEIASIEIFGPVLSLTHVQTIDEAIDVVNASPFGNMACLFTSSGAAARKFRYEARAGNIGINIGVAAPMAFFPFSGWKESFFGDMHAQGRDAIEFYTEKKVVVERWPREWSRKF